MAEGHHGFLCPMATAFLRPQKDYSWPEAAVVTATGLAASQNPVKTEKDDQLGCGLCEKELGAGGVGGGVGLEGDVGVGPVVGGIVVFHLKGGFPRVGDTWDGYFWCHFLR